MTPLFSVITPTFNCAEYILRSYGFLKKQTESNWEWILVDDGSTDNTKVIIEIIKDERIKFISYKDNKGRGYARNLGLKNSSGQIIVIWDIDDIYFPNRLQIIKSNIKNNDFFVSKAIVVDNNFNIKGVRGFYENNLYTSFVHPSLAFNITIKEKIRYDEAMPAGEDLNSMIFLTNNCKGFFYSEPLMLYVEDREVNLKKTLISNYSHLKTIRRSYKYKTSKIDFISYYLLVLKFIFKIFILNLFRFNPELYNLTIRLRSIDSDPREYQKYISFINDLKTQLGIQNENRK